MKKLWLWIFVYTISLLLVSCSTKKHIVSHEKEMLEYKKKESVEYKKAVDQQKDSVSKRLLDLEIEKVIYYPEVYFDSVSKQNKQPIKSIERIIVKKQKKDSVAGVVVVKVDSTVIQKDSVSYQKDSYQKKDTAKTNKALSLWMIWVLLILLFIIYIHIKLWRNK